MSPSHYPKLCLLFGKQQGTCHFWGSAIENIAIPMLPESGLQEN